MPPPKAGYTQPGAGGRMLFAGQPVQEQRMEKPAVYFYFASTEPKKVAQLIFSG
jgi:hypothetical protein